MDDYSRKNKIRGLKVAQKITRFFLDDKITNLVSDKMDDAILPKVSRICATVYTELASSLIEKE